MQLDQAAPALGSQMAVVYRLKQQAAGNLNILQPIQNRPIGFIKMYALKICSRLLTGVLNSNIAVACQKLADYLAFGWFPKQQHSIMLK